MFAEIIVDMQNNQVNRTYDYHIPTYLEDFVLVGTRVFVPFGKNKLLGFVVKIKEDATFDITKVKDIIEVIDLRRPLNEEFVELAKYMAVHYFSFYSSCLLTMLPSALKVRYNKDLILVNRASVSKDIGALFINTDRIPFSDKLTEFLPQINREIKQGNLDYDINFYTKSKDKVVTMVYIKDYDGQPTSKKGKELFDYLLELGEPVALSLIINDMGYSRSVVNTLVNNAILGLQLQEVYRPISRLDYVNKEVTLTKEQIAAIHSISGAFNQHEIFLLHGVTGSGKTEVYLEVIDQCLAIGKTALLLVPEISLTPQMTARIYSRFGQLVAVLHSGLSIGEKYDEWKKIIKGEAKIVVGARSAIFAPLTNLGVIIIDEEHESSYRQENNPKYDAIDIAIQRAKTHNAPLVLGSATPSVNDYYKAANGEYTLLELRNRPNSLVLPKTEIIDMREELKNGNRLMFSKALQNALKNCIARKEQAILFLNRRGFSRFVMCRSCGEVVKCPHCDVSLTYHKANNTLLCHQCGYQTPVPTTCPICHSQYIKYVGTGTEKIEEEIQRIVPGSRVIRMDADTTTTKDSYASFYENFLKGEADILVGTQMIAKGLDFPKVTLVGVMNADLSLKYPTYDANEVTFDLIEQVSGRAGRSLKDSHVIIQTYNKDNWVINYASKHDYESFFNTEIKRRNLAYYPPFSEIVELMVSGKNCDFVFEEAKKMVKYLQKFSSTCMVYGPVQAELFRVKDAFRFIITIKYLESNIIEALAYISSLYQNKKELFLSISRR